MDKLKRENIMNKIKGLFAVVNDAANESEVQNAIMLAQKLMVKYNIEKEEIENINNHSNKLLDNFEMTEAESRIRWYKKLLAGVISKNFRTKCFTQTEYSLFDKEKPRKTKLCLIGLEDDCLLTQEVYFLTLFHMLRLGKEYKDLQYETTYKDKKKSRKFTTVLLDSYYMGFIDGLVKSFEEQLSSFENTEYAIAVQTPIVVIERWNHLSADMSPAKDKVIDKVHSSAYKEGEKDGYNANIKPFTKID